MAETEKNPQKENGIFASMGEALMIGLLVVLFVTPFVVATVLTPEYDSTGGQTAVVSEPEPRVSQVVSDESVEERRVLGVEAESVSGIVMLVPKDLVGVRLESYATSETDGEFLYAVESLGSKKVLDLENRGTKTEQVEVRVNDSYEGEFYVGSREISGGNKLVSIDPGEDVSISIDPDSSGRLHIWAIVK